MIATGTQEEEVMKKGKSEHFKRKFYKGDNSGNEKCIVRKFRKFSQQIGVDIYLDPKTE
jgi:hypothetical protein